MVARTEDRKFGAFSLDDTNGITIEAITAKSLAKVSFKERLRVDGANVSRDSRPGLTISMKGKLAGTDTGVTATRLDAFLNALNNGEDYFQIYDDRRLQCRLAKTIQYQMVKGTAGLVYKWSAQFRSRASVWESPTTVTTAFTATGSAGPHTLTGPSVGGSAPCWPTITITNAHASIGVSDKILTLTNTNNLKQLQLIGLSLNVNQSIVLDMKEGRIGDGLVTAVTPQAIDGTFFEFPDGAAFVLELAHNIGAGVNLGISVSHRAAYWTI